MLRVAVLDHNNFDKLAAAIRQMYVRKAGRVSASGDMSVEFAEEMFPGSAAELPVICDMRMKRRGISKPRVIVVNEAEDGSDFGFLRDFRTIILNSDCNKLRGAGKLRRQSIITYGFNSRATVTASSVRDDQVMVCIQRAIPTISGGRIDQQEFCLNIGAGDRNISHLLAAVTVALIDDEG